MKSTKKSLDLGELPEMVLEALDARLRDSGCRDVHMGNLKGNSAPVFFGLYISSEVEIEGDISFDGAWRATSRSSIWSWTPARSG